MTRNMEKPTRSEITEQVETDKEKMREKIDALTTAAEDSETVQGTLGGLDLEGVTSDGAAEVLEALEKAESVAGELFDAADRETDESQNEMEHLEGEIQDRADASNSDSERLEEAVGKIERQETSGEVERAREAVAREIEFLEGQREEARRAREENERLQQEHEGRVRTRGS